MNELIWDNAVLISYFLALYHVYHYMSYVAKTKFYVS